VQVSPNPFVEQVTLHLPTDAERPLLIQLIGAGGQMLDYFRLMPGETLTKNWADLPSGMYFLKYERGGQMILKQ